MLKTDLSGGSSGNSSMRTLLVPSQLMVSNYCADALYVHDCFESLPLSPFSVIQIFVCFCDSVFSYGSIVFRKWDLKKRLFLVLVFELFLQKSEMSCKRVKYGKNWKKLSKLRSLDHPGPRPPKGPTTSSRLKRWPFTRGQTSCIAHLGNIL